MGRYQNSSNQKRRDVAKPKNYVAMNRYSY